MPMKPQGDFRELGEAAREAGCGESRLRSLADRGVVPHIRTKNGQRLFDDASIAAARAHLQRRQHIRRR
jgi:DNA-binding transcriptional MerR regulator